MTMTTMIVAVLLDIVVGIALQQHRLSSSKPPSIPILHLLVVVPLLLLDVDTPFLCLYLVFSEFLLFYMYNPS